MYPLPQDNRPLAKSYRIRRVPSLAIGWAAHLLPLEARRAPIRLLPRRPLSVSEFAALVGRVVRIGAAK